VRTEIAEALAGRARVVPVLVESAEMPTVDQLPADIAEIARCQAVRLRHYSVDSDIAALVAELALGVSDATTVADGDRELYPLPGTDRVLGVVPGSIHRAADIDVWVNSENTDLLMARWTEFSVSAIIRYLGAAKDAAGEVVTDSVAEELLARVPRRPVAPGTAVATGSGSLAESHGVRRVIHVASVIGEPGAGFRQVRDIGACVVNVLRTMAGEPGLRTVLFPLLGAGAAVRADPRHTAEAMVGAVLDHLDRTPDSPVRGVFFLGYTVRELSVLRAVLASRGLAPAAVRQG
jgi:hypothetical protein